MIKEGAMVRGWRVGLSKTCTDKLELLANHIERVIKSVAAARKNVTLRNLEYVSILMMVKDGEACAEGDITLRSGS